MSERWVSLHAGASLRIGGFVRVRAARSRTSASSVGSFTWRPGWAIQVWDRLMAAGQEFGIRPGGYRVLGHAADGEGIPLLRDRPDVCSTTRSRRASASVSGWTRRLQVARAGSARGSTPAAHARRGRRGIHTYIRRRGGAREGAVAGRLRSCAYGFTASRRTSRIRTSRSSRSPGGRWRSRSSAAGARERDRRRRDLEAGRQTR